MAGPLLSLDAQAVERLALLRVERVGEGRERPLQGVDRLIHGLEPLLQGIETADRRERRLARARALEDRLGLGGRGLELVEGTALARVAASPPARCGRCGRPPTPGAKPLHDLRHLRRALSVPPAAPRWPARRCRRPGALPVRFDRCCRRPTTRTRRSLPATGRRRRARTAPVTMYVEPIVPERGRSGIGPPGVGEDVAERRTARTRRRPSPSGSCGS